MPKHVFKKLYRELTIFVKIVYIPMSVDFPTDRKKFPKYLFSLRGLIRSNAYGKV